MGVLDFERRYVCYDYNCNSSWYSWGRWVAFAVIVGAAFIIFLLFACLSARRRRARGRRPFYGTSWMAPPPYQQGNYQYAPAPPQYQTQDPNQGYYAPPPEQGYYATQQNGIELQQPQHAYGAGDHVYAPPAGPPPAKN
ncbi:uncharacterized protein TRUGW13939_06474 [Talaromyces rugulosus]|uniref:Uncharacterized protein n=1 Tax=Talaromyces rugulosus TaxID=121627 RepID=A0A7H8QZ18_TALRU|nr:uncharacterized protein TRUGW13939_06474 [Talaromyces rugulosus]QKX59340.1 hypothetical protein TRUGW13939_06474 [Talaromyces rugulosus]